MKSEASLNNGFLHKMTIVDNIGDTALVLGQTA